MHLFSWKSAQLPQPPATNDSTNLNDEDSAAPAQPQPEAEPQQAASSAAAASAAIIPQFAPTEQLVYRGFNDTNSCVVVITPDGLSFDIYRISATGEVLTLRFSLQESQPGNVGQFSVASLMGRTNIGAFVGGGENPKAPPNRAILWDLAAGRMMAELPATETVLNVRPLWKRITVVTTASYTQLFDFGTNESLVKWTTQSNPTGALAVSSDEQNAVVAFPGREAGHVQVVYLDFLDEPIDLHPHNNEVRALAITRDGKRLASASSKGTVINVYELNRGASQPPTLRALRRGRDAASITSLSFSHDGRFLCASSDRNTIHVWDLGKPAPTRYQFGDFSYKGEKSFGKFVCPYPKTLCGFAPDAPHIYALSDTGLMMVLRLDVESGAIEKINEGGTKEWKIPPHSSA